MAYRILKIVAILALLSPLAIPTQAFPSRDRATIGTPTSGVVGRGPSYKKRAEQVQFTPVTHDAQIQLILDQVDEATVRRHLGALSGEWPIPVGEEWYTLRTRNSYSGEPIYKATRFVGEHLEALGLDVAYHVWGGQFRPNVIGELTGRTNPEEIYILCAHLDDMPPGAVAPGADDNASGVVAVLIAADILSQYDWDCTLRFALWTGEEQGLLGSEAYAQEAHAAGEQIRGVLNLDMIGYNTPGSPPGIDLHARAKLTPTLELAQQFSDVVGAYDLDLIPQIKRSGTGASDHGSFWHYSYTAILAIEDIEDFNPHYHSTQDLPERVDLAYLTTFVKAAVASFAHMSGDLIPIGIGDLSGRVTVANSADPVPGATVTARDQAGRSFSVQSGAAGAYTHTLEAGTYTVTASALKYLPITVSDVVILTDTVHTLDLALEPPLPLPALSLNLERLTMTMRPGQPCSTTLKITNHGVVPLTFTLEATPPVVWLRTTPGSGTVMPHKTRGVTVAWERASLDPGIYTTILDVYSNDPFRPQVSLPATLTLLACTPPYTAGLSWAPLTPETGQAVTLTGAAWGPDLIWRTDVVDDGQIGRFVSLALEDRPGGTGAGRPYIAYDGDNNLRLAHYETGWVTETVDDRADAVGHFVSLDLDSQGNPHVAYNGDNRLIYATRDPKVGPTHASAPRDGPPLNLGWQIETVDDRKNVGQWASLAMDERDVPFIAYYDNRSDDLRLACREGSAWITETVDTIDHVGTYASLALPTAQQDGGGPQIAYHYYRWPDEHALIYARRIDQAWITETVDAGNPPTTGSVGRHPSLALNAQGNPRISYLGEGTLRYAYYEGAWVTETVDGGAAGYFSSLALDTAGNPAIAYWDYGQAALQLARCISNTWQTETIHQAASIEEIRGDIDLALDEAGHPHVVFFDRADRSLKHSWQGYIEASGPTTFAWDLGDGTRATGAVVGHRYTQPGVYTVTMTATNPCGERTVHQTISVQAVWRLYLPLISKPAAGPSR